MSIKISLKKFWHLIWKDDSLKGWIISLIFIFLFVKFIFFPVLNFTTGTKLPLVVVESCSMYHKGDIFSDFNSWWSKHTIKYTQLDIFKENFQDYKLRDGFNKGDIIFSLGVKIEKIEKGDVIIFKPNEEALKQTPIIHRVAKIENEKIQTMGDNNIQSLTKNNNIYKIDETNIENDQIIGKAILKIPYLGWAKLIFFDWKKPVGERGFCNEN